MQKDFQKDVVIQTIASHYAQSSNFKTHLIQKRLLEKNISMPLDLIQDRIDEYKSSQMYRDFEAPSSAVQKKARG